MKGKPFPGSFARLLRIIPGLSQLGFYCYIPHCGGERVALRPLLSAVVELVLALVVGAGRASPLHHRFLWLVSFVECHSRSRYASGPSTSLASSGHYGFKYRALSTPYEPGSFGVSLAVIPLATSWCLMRQAKLIYPVWPCST